MKITLSPFTRTCLAFAAATILGTPLLLLCGGRVAGAVRAAWAGGTGLEALLWLAVLALLAEAVRE